MTKHGRELIESINYYLYQEKDNLVPSVVYDLEDVIKKITHIESNKNEANHRNKTR